MLNLNLPAFERTDLASNLAARGEIFRRVLERQHTGLVQTLGWPHDLHAFFRMCKHIIINKNDLYFA
ncbi:MAG: hypothetical protein A4E43_00437 [Methanosaeta sp. PtaB.Bin005]|jgi:hypothetical protein|nr:MAG: hypothetical protein A4E43_00437 [Methanosaeta sp. PtaB.Bin005]